VHFQNAGAGDQRERFAVLVNFDVVSLSGAAHGTASAAATTAARPTAATVISSLPATVSPAAATPSLFLGHVSQYLTLTLILMKQTKLNETANVS
jgi:hypothetical protein